MANILLVEDDEQQLRMYGEKLEHEGFKVKVVKTGKEALESLKSERPDLILLDIMLPGGINGFDVLENIKRDPKLSNLPVIVLTNLDSEEKVAREIGANDYLVKANTPLNEIVAKVKEYTDV